MTRNATSRRFAARLAELLEPLGRYEIIFVNDCSADAT